MDLGFLSDIDDESVAIAAAGRISGSIRKLCMCRADLTDASLVAMYACTRLEHLDVSDIGELTSDEVLRARFMTREGYRLLASANFREVVLGCIEAKLCK